MKRAAHVESFRRRLEEDRRRRDRSVVLAAHRELVAEVVELAGWTPAQARRFACEHGWDSLERFRDEF